MTSDMVADSALSATLLRLLIGGVDEAFAVDDGVPLPLERPEKCEKDKYLTNYKLYKL